MNSFQIKTTTGTVIRFDMYTTEAPQTCQHFLQLLPFTRTFYHARISGQEIWIDDAPPFDAPQENASIYTQPGEIVIGPFSPQRNKIKGCMGIFYGEGQLLDAGNIFGKVLAADLPQLQQLGDDIWRKGAQEITFEST